MSLPIRTPFFPDARRGRYECARPYGGRAPDRPVSLGNFTAIVKIKRAGRVFRHQANRLWQREAVVLVVRDAEGRVQQAGGVIVRGEDIQQAERGEPACRHVAGVRSAAHDIWRAHQDVHAVLTRCLCRFKRGGKFSYHAAKLVGFAHVIVRGVVMAGGAIFRSRHIAAMERRFGCDHWAASWSCSSS